MNDVALLEKELDELYKITALGEERGLKYTIIRKGLAYFLKFIAAGGSLVIATGLSPEIHQGIGIAVLVAVFIDSLSSNHKRLIAEVEAGYAFRALRNKIKWAYNRDAAPLFKPAQNDDENAMEKLHLLMHNSHVSLSSGIEDIRVKLERADVEALKSLCLDQERNEN